MFHRKPRIASFAAVALVFILCSGQYVAAEIPHENFDLVGSDLDMLIGLLKQGINATELALVSCLLDKPELGTQNLTLLDDILMPVRELIFEIRDVASSYYSLTYLLPPFENLSIGGHYFIQNQSIYLSNAFVLKSLTGKALSVSERDLARGLLWEAKTSIFSMNSNLDSMDFTADEIANLTVDNKKVFNTTYLKELIDRLRIRIDEYSSHLDRLFFRIKWGEAFLLLVAERTYYYLGETVRIAGYLSNGTAAMTGKAVYLWKDLALFGTDTTDQNGVFNISWRIPIDPIELGRHNLTIESIVEGVSISDSLEIYILKIPTRLTLTINADRFSPDEQVIATAYLQDYRNRFLPKEIVVYVLDGSYRYWITSGSGSTTWTFEANIGWGGHNMYVQYNGSDIYESCEDNVLHFDVNLPTHLRLELSEYRVEKGDNVTVISRLYLNDTEPLPYKEIVVKMDGSFLKSEPTLENGSMLFVLRTGTLPTGAHVLQAFFISPDPKYQNAISEPVTLIVYVQSSNENGDLPNWWDDIIGSFLWILLLILIILILAILVLSRDTIRNAMSGELPRKTPGIKLPEEAAAALLAEPGPPAPDSPISGEMHGTDLSIAPPKVAIIKQYGVLLDSLRAERGLPIRPNMTAREIGELMKDGGYPSAEVGLATQIFEKAMYSAENVTFEDWTAFKRVTETLRSFDGRGTR